MKLFKEIGKAFFIGSLIFIIVGLIQYLNGETISDGRQLLVLFAYNQLYSVALYMVNAYFFTSQLNKHGGRLFELRNLAIGVGGAIYIFEIQ